jgi:hypothetical protein
MAKGYDLYLRTQNPDDSKTDFELVKAFGAALAQNGVIDAKRGGDDAPRRFRITIVDTPPVSHPRPSGYTEVVPRVTAIEIPEFEIVCSGNCATATDTMLGYVYELGLRRSEHFVTLTSPGRERAPADSGNLNRARAAVLSEVRENGLIPKA